MLDSYRRSFGPHLSIHAPGNCPLQGSMPLVFLAEFGRSERCRNLHTASRPDHKWAMGIPRLRSREACLGNAGATLSGCFKTHRRRAPRDDVSQRANWTCLKVAPAAIRQRQGRGRGIQGTSPMRCRRAGKRGDGRRESNLGSVLSQTSQASRCWIARSRAAHADSLSPIPAKTSAER
jgi:hypothetical protein